MFENPTDILKQVFEHAAMVPFLQIDSLAVGSIIFEVARECCRYRRIEQRNIDLIVDAKRTVIEVGRAHYAPHAIDDSDLGMNH